ncbi:MAG: hypothetical protein [Circular genetic element sp.]|nr:MAG: hypothetical protein [Circular genetic element sp.]
MQPTERNIRFTCESQKVTLVDSAALLSEVNRRAYRQGMEYAYDSLEMFQNQAGAEAVLSVYRLPQTWVTTNAWVKTFHAWKDQRDSALAESDSWSVEAKYSDFKCYYNISHATGSTPGGVTLNIADCIDVMTRAEAQAVDPDARSEWMYSEVTVPTTSGDWTSGAQDMQVGILGPDVGVYAGMIHNYALSRARPHPADPSTVDGAEEGLFNRMRSAPPAYAEDIIEDVMDRNEAPPYIVGGLDSAEEFYLGGSNSPLTDYKGTRVDRLICTASSILTSDSTRAFTAYCGLIYIFNDSEEDVEVQLTFTPGNYKGVAARPMQDVN